MTDVQLGNLTPANIEQLKLINTTTLPVRYSQKFYDDLLTVYKSEFVKIAFCHGFSIGAICARIESPADIQSKKRLYIMTINVLAAYRHQGVATKLLNHVLELAKKQADIEDIYLHVQVGNNEAKEFYEKNGFQVQEVIQNYYKKIEPADCYLLVKKLI